MQLMIFNHTHTVAVVVSNMTQNDAERQNVTIQYNTIQYNTIQYNTIQYNVITRKKKKLTDHQNPGRPDPTPYQKP